MSDKFVIPETPVFNTEMEKLTTNTKGHADHFNERYKQLLLNDDYLKKEMSNVTLNEKTANEVPRTNEKTDIIGMINELFQNASRGKELITNVVGEPLLATDTFSEIKNKFVILKNLFRSKLREKGLLVSGDYTLQGLIEEIELINTGKKFASGSASPAYYNSNFRKLTISGLDFTPKYIAIARRGSSTGSSYITVYDEALQGLKCVVSGKTQYPYGIDVSGNWYVRQGGFQLPIIDNGNGGSWFAVGD